MILARDPGVLTRGALYIHMAAVLAAAPVHAAPFVDPDTGHSYEVIEQGLTWDAARTAAATMSTSSMVCHLAAITTAAEDSYVVSQLPSDTDMWIGGRQATNLDCTGDNNQASYWGTWVTGESWSYTNWDTGEGEPDGCEEQCLAYGEDNPILWENGECDDTDISGFLVECEPLSATAPALGPTALIMCLLGLGAAGLYRLRAA